jgi:hypothetical protein
VLTYLPKQWHVFFKCFFSLRQDGILNGHKSKHLFVHANLNNINPIDVGHAFKSVCLFHIGKACSPHAMRAIQVTSEFDQGLSPRQQVAMNAGRQHSLQTAKTFYTRFLNRENGEIAERVCAQRWDEMTKKKRKRVEVVDHDDEQDE